MSVNDSNNVEDTDMAEYDGEKVVTMMDVLQEQQDFEDDANAVLGASDEKNCTYSKGYIKRQAIYACLTCCANAKEDPTCRAGVCLACSLNCHENHELIELYTKRNFRCDCGNPKFNSNPCQYTPDKPDLNAENSYNQNFSGLYCTCHRPYPDPEATVEDEMIQCIICEDWLHASHLDAGVPSTEQYSEMVCKNCMEKNEFLHDYSHLAISTENEDVDIVNVSVTNGSLEKTMVNSTVDSTEVIKENPHNDMKIDEQTENKSGENDISDDNNTNTPEVTKEAENVENVPQTTSDLNLNSKEDTNTDLNNSTKESMETTLEEKESAKPGETLPLNIKESELTTETMLEGENDTTEDTVNKSCDNSTKNHEPNEAASTSEQTDYDDKPNLTVSNENGDNNEDVKTDLKNNKINETPENKDEVNTKNTEETEKDTIDETSQQDIETKQSEDITKETTLESTNEVPKEIVNSIKENKRKLSTDESTDVSIKKVKLDGDNKCIRLKSSKKTHKGATFWPSNFRQKLCTCTECLTMYKDLSVLFLTDPEDTVFAYEALGKELVDGRQNQYEKGLEALSSLDRIQQINALTEYNRMRDKLLDFLKSFKDRKEIVKEEDIKAFFAGMKPKREPDGVYFCR